MKKVKNYKMFLESIIDSDKKIEGLDDVLRLIQDNTDSGWKGDDLQESFECIVLEDVQHTHDDAEGTTTYNGWYEKLTELAQYNHELKEIIQMVDSNKESLWEHGINSTFDCVIMEDIEVLNDDDEYSNLYNGWYSKLQELA